MKTDLSPVTVLRGESAAELGKRICDAVVPRKPKDTPMLLKPNICGFDNRMEGKTDRKYLAWSPPRTAKPNFHVPEAFGVLVLDP